MIYMELIHNLALLIALTTLSGFVIQNRRKSKIENEIFQGLIFAVVASIGMFYPVLYSEGIFFDGRSVVISLCALFFGPVSASIVVVITLLLRTLQGGSGMVMGESVIIASALIGLFFHYTYFKKNHKVGLSDLFLMGISVHAVMVLLMFTLPDHIVNEVIVHFALSVMVIYPVSTMIIGKIISDNIERKDFISELKESELKFKNLAENTSIAIAMFQNDKWIYANPYSSVLTGYTNEELLRMNFWDFVHNDDVDKVKKIGEIRQKGNETDKSYEFKIVTKNGDIKTVWLTGSNTVYNGLPAGLITVIDITKRKEAEHKLQELRDIINRSSSVAFTWKNEPGWPVEYVSENVFSLTGYTAKEFTENEIEFAKIIHADDLNRVSEEVEQNINSSKTLDFKHKYYRIITKSGEIKWVSDSTTVINDKENLTVMLKGIIEDITEKKNIEDRLKQSEEKFRAIFDSITDGVDMRRISPEGLGEFIEINKAYCNLLGYTRNELSDLLPAEYLDPDIIDSMQYIIEELYNSKEIRLTAKQRKKTGEIVPVEIHCALFSLNGKDYFVSTSRDISERIEAEKIMRDVNFELEKLSTKLAESNKDLENFAYIVSHDLKEPLRMISSFVILLQQKYGKNLNEEALQYIRFAVEGSNKMNALIEGLLQFSRISTQGASFKNLKTQTIVEYVIEVYKSKLELSEGSVDIGILPDIVGDDAQISQLFQNLIGNAIKFTLKGVPPKIEISAEENSDEWIFKIKDNGIGIDDKHKDRIFDMFRRLHSTEKYEGTGIGLAFCKQIVKRHGGEIWVESEPEKGSAFIFTIKKNK